jgi:hypothetical protein
VDLKPDYAPAGSLDRKRYLRASMWTGLTGSTSTSETKVDYGMIADMTKTIVSNRRAVLALTHGPLKEADLALVQDYIQLVRNVFANVKRVEEHDLHIVLCFGFEMPQKSRPLEISEISVEELGSIPPHELTQHLDAYGRFYDLSRSEAEETAGRLIEDFDGRFIVTYE